jgi:hypothetical protein
MPDFSPDWSLNDPDTSFMSPDWSLNESKIEADDTSLNNQNINLENNESSQHFWLENTTFSPDNDGHQDHLVIHHNLPSAGYTISVNAYTRNGAHVCHITDNQLSTPQGYTLWNGTNSNSETIPAGLYILVIQATHLNGSKITQKLICIKI